MAVVFQNARHARFLLAGGNAARPPRASFTHDAGEEPRLSAPRIACESDNARPCILSGIGTRHGQPQRKKGAEPGRYDRLGFFAEQSIQLAPVQAKRFRGGRFIAVESQHDILDQLTLHLAKVPGERKLRFAGFSLAP